MLIAANLAATVLRFLLLRAWVFPERRTDDLPARDTAPASATASTPVSSATATVPVPASASSDTADLDPRTAR